VFPATGTLYLSEKVMKTLMNSMVISSGILPFFYFSIDKVKPWYFAYTLSEGKSLTLAPVKKNGK